MDWFDLSEDFYNKTLPIELMSIREAYIIHPPGTDLKVCRHLAQARILLDYSNQKAVKNELLAVNSDRLSQILKPLEHNLEIEWLGIDPYCGGYGSLLREGLFKAPDAFADYRSLINSHGLFDLDSPDLARYVRAYLELTSSANLEPMDNVIEDMDQVRLGRITFR
jgi:hypothetical protein